MWSLDRHVDYLAAGVVDLFYYERRGVPLRLRAGLGHGAIYVRLAPEAVMQQAAASDVLVLTQPFDRLPPFYPYDQSIDAQRPALEGLAAERFTLYREYHALGHDVRVFVRQESP